MKQISFLFFVLLFSFRATAQQEISGTVTDVANGLPLIGAFIIADEGKTGTAADINGQYKISLPDGPHILVARYSGYIPDTVKITVAGQPLTVDFKCGNVIKPIEIFADIVIDRKVPVAVSNITADQIRQEGDLRDITMLANSTPGIYASEQGGGFGDSRVTIRGVDQRNVGVLIDGVPVNDMENGAVYWSNWSGLIDVTQTMQIQRGLGASKLAIPSVGGTMNIITKGIDDKRSFSFRSTFGDDNTQKYSFGFNSGAMAHGWGITLAGSRRTSDGWVDNLWTNEWSYFAKIQKQFGDHNLLTIACNGAPQSHGQRYHVMPIAILNRNYAQKLGINVDSVYKSNNGYTTTYQGERGMRYNPDWGYYFDNNRNLHAQSEDINFYNKPEYYLSDFWSPNTKFSLSAVAYLSVGHGGGTYFNSAVNRDTTTGLEKLKDVYATNSHNIDPLYSTTLHKSTRALLAAMNDHFWYGALVTAKYAFSSDISLLAGLDARSYKGSHYRTVYDLFGGDWFYDGSDKNQPNGAANLASYMKYTGDKVSYYNDSYVDWGGVFAQGEYSHDRWSAFLTLSGSMTQYQRVDYFKKRDVIEDDGTVVPMIVGYNETYYTNGTQSGVAQNGANVTVSGDTTYIDNPTGADYAIANAKGYAWTNARTATTEKKKYPGYTIKSGANYNINDNLNVFLNAGYMVLAPRFNTVFDNNNKVYPGIKSQYIYAVEAGFGARYAKWAGHINIYYTDWLNKPPYSSPTKSIAGDVYTYDMTGLNTLLKGIELDGKWKATHWLEAEAFASFGDWTYQSSGTAYLYDANYVLTDTVQYSAKGVHVGDAAQTQIGGSLRWIPFKGAYLKPRYTWFDRYYSKFDPIDESPVYDQSHIIAPSHIVKDNRDRDTWKMPAFGLLDIYAGYEVPTVHAGKNAHPVEVEFNVTVFNVLNTAYVSDAVNGTNFDATSANVYMGMGRRWAAGMRISF